VTQELFAEKFQPSLKECVGALYDRYVYIDGRFVKGEEAKISVWDHGLLYGDGVFEGIRAYDGKVFKLDEHIERLLHSAKALKITVPLTKEELKRVVLETLRINGLKDAHVRIIVTRGPGIPGLDPKRAARPSVIVTAYPYPPLLGRKPIRLKTASIRRKSPHSIDARIKCLNYLDSILAKLEAVAAGADDAVMLDVNGFVAEASAANIFVVKGSTIYTPPPIAALHGITRATVMEIARELGYRVEEKNLTLYDLYTADEVFLTGTATEIAPVEEIDGRKIPKAPGPITQQIINAYQKHVREKSITPIPTQ